uniref:Uncharacterized protein n=1 Tax=Glossina palpalis gambiensis TaxID=67801 RepID=A0A1B0AYE8_9MUSC
MLRLQKTLQHANAGGAGAAFVRKSGNATGYARDNPESASILRKAAFPKNESKLDLKATMVKDHDILKALDDDNNGGSSEEEDKTDLDKFPIKLNEKEGQVGRLLRYKSGKIKLVLGESYFDLNMGMETGFLQESIEGNVAAT